MTCASSNRLGSALASAQSDQSLRYSHEEILGPSLLIEHTANADQTVRMLGAHVILLVLSAAAQFN